MNAEKTFYDWEQQLAEDGTYVYAVICVCTTSSYLAATLVLLAALFHGIYVLVYFSGC